ncbi:MAG: presenilin family intramembrane aspartyl protease [Candidatus ainarchaeum sp.]|nr:presenilin family intramembrane aspartyl protease [Candidatus ainarchaeum sp.]
MRMITAILAFFIIAQLLGIFTGITILFDITKNPYVTSLVVTGDAENPFNALFFITYMLLGAVVMVLLIRLFRLHVMVFRVLEFVMIATASSVVFYAFLRLAMGYAESTALGILMGLAFSAAKAFRPALKNSAAIMATAGVGVIFGISLGLFPVVLFLVLLSVYDYLSVFMTKHMVEMADFVVQKDLAFTVTARAPPPAPGEREQRVDLGTGDMVAPIMLEVSALTFNPVATAFVFVGGVVALGLFLFLVWKKKMVLPALPPIVLGMLAFLALGFLLGAY